MRKTVSGREDANKSGRMGNGLSQGLLVWCSCRSSIQLHLDALTDPQERLLVKLRYPSKGYATVHRETRCVQLTKFRIVLIHQGINRHSSTSAAQCSARSYGGKTYLVCSGNSSDGLYSCTSWKFGEQLIQVNLRNTLCLERKHPPGHLLEHRGSRVQLAFVWSLAMVAKKHIGIVRIPYVVRYGPRKRRVWALG